MHKEADQAYLFRPCNKMSVSPRLIRIITVVIGVELKLPKWIHLFIHSTFIHSLFCSESCITDFGMAIQTLLSIERWFDTVVQNVLTPPFAKAMDITAAASMTHDKGFHIKPKNFKNLLSYKESN